MTDNILQIQNDEFRKHIMLPIFGEPTIQGHYLYTSGIVNLGAIAQVEIAAEIRNFECFSEDNDPYGEHDFGSLKYEGQKIFWKIDYYDLEYQAGSEDPADPTKTRRVLTIMLAEEY